MNRYRIMMITVLLTIVGRTLADNLSVANVEVDPGETKQVAIELNNSSNQYTAFQFDLVLPEGISIAKNNKDKLIASLNEDRKDDHTLNVSDLGGNTYRFLSFSMTNAEFYGTSGALVYVTLQVSGGIAKGVKTAMLQSQVMTKVDGNQSKWADKPFQITVNTPVVPEIKADNKNRMYGDDNPELTYTTSMPLTGLPVLTTTATKTSPVGEYDIVVERGTVVGEYTSVAGKLTITKAPLTIGGGTYTIKQGEALPVFVATYSGFKNGETSAVLKKQPTLSTTATSNSTPGTYDVIVSGAEAQNYEISYNVGTLTITKTEDENMSTKRTIHVATAGTLPNLITESEKYIIEELTLTGELNGTDFRLLRDMAGCNYLGEETAGKLKVLDISEARVLAGGERYVDATQLPEFGGTIGGKFRYTIEKNDEVPQHVFHGCKLNKVILPKNVSVIGSAAFSNCKSLTSIAISNNVTSIGDAAFEECSDLTSITIPNGVTSIGSGAFRECSSLTSITISNSVTSIGNGVFQYCSSLKSIIIPNSVTLIDEWAFWGCSSLTSITIPNSVTSIGEQSFYNCSSLTSITIPNSVTSIGSYAFYGCSGLTSISIPNSVTSINNGVFSYCSSLKSITIPNSVTSIEAYAFEYCSSLKTIAIPNSITSISDAVFYGCSGLTSITIPNSVTSIGWDAFYGCSSLTTITIPNSVTSIGSGAFLFCSSLTSITIPNSVTYILECAFQNCSSLTSITIPNSVTSINYRTFYGCSSLTSITIPNSVTSIGSYAFFECSGLTSVISEIDNPFEIDNTVFSGISSDAVLQVPQGTMSKYKAISGWGAHFKKIVEASKCKLTYLIDGETYKSYDMDFGTSITAESEPVKEGYRFSGWSEIPETMPDHDVVVTGHFEKVYDVSSAVSLANIIMGKTTVSDDDLVIYDLNHDNELNIGDMILVIKKILNSMNVSMARTTRAADPLVDLSRFTAVQFTVSVPEGSSISDIGIIGNNRNTHQVEWQQIDESNYAVVIYSNTNQMLSPENGSIMEIALSDENSSDIVIGNVILATPEGNRVWLNSLSAYATVTGIEELTASEPFDVYDLNGRKVRSQCHNLKGLAGRIYIVNGKKTVIK